MSTITLTGPTIRSGEDNMVLREALIVSPTRRRVNTGDHFLVELGVQEGDNVSFIGSWKQTTQDLGAGSPLSVLDEDQANRRLRAGQVFVVRITATGAPTTIEGARVDIRMARVGGRSGAPKPLVASGVNVKDPNVRTSVAALQRQVNTGGLADVKQSIQLHDPVTLAPVAAFHGRLQVDSTTQISLQRYSGNWVDVGGGAVSITSAGLAITTSDGLLASTGAVTSTAPSSSTLYYVYLHATSGLRLSATAPTRFLGTYYLGTTGGATDWRLCGVTYTDGSTHFLDAVATRHLANYYNRVPTNMYVCPNYVDDNATTSYTFTNTSYESKGSMTFVSFGDYDVDFEIVSLPGGAITRVGVGRSTATGVFRTIQSVAADVATLSVRDIFTPSAGLYTVHLSANVSSGTCTMYSDLARFGASADPASTYMTGRVML